MDISLVDYMMTCLGLIKSKKLLFMIHLDSEIVIWLKFEIILQRIVVFLVIFNINFETFEDKIEQNKLLISSSIDKPMTAVILMLRGNRFTKSNQDFLKSLNDWTFGKIWRNLIILNGRQRFRIEDLRDRLATQSQRILKPARVVNLKKLDGNIIYQGMNISYIL